MIALLSPKYVVFALLAMSGTHDYLSEILEPQIYKEH